MVTRLSVQLIRLLWKIGTGGANVVFLYCWTKIKFFIKRVTRHETCMKNGRKKRINGRLNKIFSKSSNETISSTCGWQEVRQPTATISSPLASRKLQFPSRAGTAEKRHSFGCRTREIAFYAIKITARDRRAAIAAPWINWAAAPCHLSCTVEINAVASLARSLAGNRKVPRAGQSWAAAAQRVTLPRARV